MSTLTGKQVAEAGLDGWTYLLGALQTRIRTPDFAAGLALVAAVGAEAERVDHHPDLDLRYTHVDVRLWSHDAGGVTQRDLRLARFISGLAADSGLTLSAAGLARLELALDTPEHAAVLPFWRAVLAWQSPDGRGPDDDEVRDPDGVLPTVWFQRSGRDEPRQRWHPDVWVDPAEVDARIAAALAAGGALVSDAEAPSFWVLADPDGNRVCLCTWQQRS
ncbi:4a-hydroxytetrahydrobiopterin dehydratase [Micromonospora aurantiaca]|uniref:4a-hydroxytetrahydrobiopterin dehydratase n=1 Tax=Micromonospora TaxID=1873 RepID=UPI0001C43BF4|nr:MULTISPECIES: 4a-hydroxytetrahydrobiopterin dehydratase [Micromonospora]ADU07322.1 transcriptional coactivator/pterin dehydratase [Micromonospora sp. L5]RNI04929.1 4a-hydroxytetrahydrobiopterin dehydratase [Micromonospora aurantiaca]SCL33945.1 4a-hydroxytetrahydrobiopterin dehydratase [Micromonospora aurantiaca]